MHSEDNDKQLALDLELGVVGGGGLYTRYRIQMIQIQNLDLVQQQQYSTTTRSRSQQQIQQDLDSRSSALDSRLQNLESRDSRSTPRIKIQIQWIKSHSNETQIFFSFNSSLLTYLALWFLVQVLPRRAAISVHPFKPLVFAILWEKKWRASRSHAHFRQIS